MKDRVDSRKNRQRKKVTYKWQKPSNVKVVFIPSVACVWRAYFVNEAHVVTVVAYVRIVQEHFVVCAQLSSKLGTVLKWAFYPALDIVFASFSYNLID